MIVVDQLYGAFEIPTELEPIVTLPEVQRLREIRLINVSSPTCGSLSDARRFTHTLGVFYLAKRLVERLPRDVSDCERMSFLVASLLHDVATPPFGHLFEYILSAKMGWHHERFVEQVKDRLANKLRNNFQIYFGLESQLRRVLPETGADSDLVWSMIRGDEPKLGPLLAGSIDIDNVDNVLRMTTLLGLNNDLSIATRLIDGLRGVTNEGTPIVEEAALPVLQRWQELRRKAYQVLAFDGACLSGQAMLTDSILAALDTGTITPEDWYLTDERLLWTLWQAGGEIRETVKRFVSGDFFDPIFTGWYRIPKGGLDYRHPDQRRRLLEHLSDATGIPCSCYVFYDSGTFSKKLHISVRSGGTDVPQEVGEKSQSTIISVFSRHRLKSAGDARRYQRPVMQVLQDHGFLREALQAMPQKEDVYNLSRQATLPI